MEYNDIKKLALLMNEMGLSTLEYTEGVSSIKMERGMTPAAPFVIEPKAELPVPSQPEATGNSYTVTSPMVGVFYASPAADKKPYVAIGDMVKAGDVLCIIEAMKMMNEITTDKSGVITEICVGNKQIVEYGHPLFRMTLD